MVSFSKRKKTLFQDANKFATQTGANIGVMLFSPSGKPFSYGSTGIEEIIDTFLKVKQEYRKRDYARVNQMVLRYWKISINNYKHGTRKKKTNINA
ncbi:hypothetical protein MTR67_040415 [Solanum verrucosum]|uniref:MADS-box domain-containing protein n=1 Tax=Solanum verrucosum TaxID=315347 RepID=A0AAF0ZRN3_SOLVR|nr:hypothetical protein MTR67_040415 [Solanum verrucosum]